MADEIIKIDVDNTKLLGMFDRLTSAIKNMKPIMAEIAEEMLFDVEQNFADEGRPDRWPELAESTIEEKAKKGYSEKMLERTGALKSSITHKSNQHEAIVGTNLVYAAIHQFGGEAGRISSRVNIPARPFLGLTDDDIENIVLILRRYIDNIPK